MKTKPNQSEFIRKYPDMPTRQLVELGAKAGITFTVARVHHVRNIDKKRGATAVKKPGRPPGTKITNDVTRKPSVMDTLLETIIEHVTAKVFEKLRSAL